jgi:hypothetical protein
VLWLSLAVFIVGCSSSNGGSSGGSAPQLVSITIQSPNTVLPLGVVIQLTATGTYSDNSTADLTSSVAWSSSNTSVARFGSAGLLNAISIGAIRVTARSVAAGVAGTIDISVAPVGGGIQKPLPTLTQVATLSSSLVPFVLPTGVTTDGTNVYVADSGNNKIKKIVIQTGTILSFAGTGVAGTVDDSPGIPAQFNNPDSITNDGFFLYVGERNSGKIRTVNMTTGVVSTLETFLASSPATPFHFNSLSGLTTDGVWLYATDSVDNVVQRIKIDTGMVDVFAGSVGVSGSSDTGVGIPPKFFQPIGITTDGIFLYVSDFGNHTIRKISISSGEVTTLAGSPGQPGAVNDVGAAARFKNPKGIATDGSNLYVSDYFSHTIRKVVISTGAVTTLAGTPGVPGGPGATAEAASAAQFKFPEGLTSDGAKLYIADSNNNAIRVMN